MGQTAPVTHGLILLAIAEGVQRATTQRLTHLFDIADVVLASIDQSGFRIVKKSSKEQP